MYQNQYSFILLSTTKNIEITKRIKLFDIFN